MMNPTLSRNLRKSFFQTCFLRSSTLQPRRSPFIFRAASTSVKEPVPSVEVLKPNLKPKAATQLRRSASASSPSAASRPSRTRLARAKCRSLPSASIQEEAKIQSGEISSHQNSLSQQNQGDVRLGQTVTVRPSLRASPIGDGRTMGGP